MRTSLSSCIGAVLLLVSTSGISYAGDGDRSDRITQFDFGSFQVESRRADPSGPRPDFRAGSQSTRQSVGSVLSPDAGIGKGASVDLSYDDAQNFVGQGRHISHWWNGEYGGSAKVSVHFGYRSQTDTMPGYYDHMSAYNAYDAVAGDWPRGQEIGCDLQGADTLGLGYMPSLDVMSNGQVVMASESHFLNGFLGDGSVFVDHQVFYQPSEFSCTYLPGTHTTSVDSGSYRQHFLDQTDGNYSRFPQVVTQWDGANTVVHLLLIEETGVPLYGDDYVDGDEYRTCVYYRKTGETAGASSWGDSQIIDSLWFPWVSMAASPYPNTGVAVSYTNPTYYGGLLNNRDDLDVWCRESFDRGLTWEDTYSVTNYMNAIQGHPDHFAAWLETTALFDSEGDLHLAWVARETTDDPYFDGYNWGDWDANLYHWEKDNGQFVPGTGGITMVADGSYNLPGDYLCGNFDTHHCGFGGDNILYLGNVNLAQCDDNLYCVWSQIHERANYTTDWMCYTDGYLPGVADDCSYTGWRIASANWDIYMSAANLETSLLWDMPRNVSDTYTPNCGLVGDPDAEGPCASESKPMVEKRGMDETGLGLDWPAETIVDLSPEQDYVGGWYLNMQYVDDQFPGPAYWGRSNPQATLNSLKWLRLACVEPVNASMIAVNPTILEWPEWVELGQTTSITITVQNNGNVALNVTEIGRVEYTGSGWLEIPMWPPEFRVMAGLGNTITFDIGLNATGLSSTQWLDGEVWLKSDAANNDSISISIHLLAATDVEPVVWDTVTSHANMFDIYFYPDGECVALAVSNHGEIGYGFNGGGSVNLDYVESETECGEGLADAIYLKSGSAFAIVADDASGGNAQLTCSYNHANNAPEYGWDPIGTKGSITGGVGTGSNDNDYDSVYTGVFVNRDTTIAMERTFYAPRSNDPENDTINFVICASKFYSGDGAGHDHVTIGNVQDWNVPSEDINVNTSGIGSDFVYMQGTDTTGVLSCQSNTNRYATEALGGGYTGAELSDFPCANDELIYSVKALSQGLLQDTTHYRDGRPLPFQQPNPEVWWNATGEPGLSADPTEMDQAIWTTYVHDYNLGANDTIYFWTVLTTVRNGEIADLENQVSYGKSWYLETVRDCDGTWQCFGTLDVNASGGGGGEPTISDLSLIIDFFELSHQYPSSEMWRLDINGDCRVDWDDFQMYLGCFETHLWEACPDILTCCDPVVDLGCCLGRVGDANKTGGDEPTIGDISVMIDWKFITGDCPTRIACLDEADVNQSGPPDAATCGDITISDISILIDYLFIGGPEAVTLNDCF